ncbi:WD40 repeat domain-containing protein [Stutzerimonas stutzeri]
MQITTVRVRVTTPQGQPVVGVAVSARLASLGVSVTDGYIDRSYVEATTDAAGIAELGLWPNVLGISGAEYRITARGADGSKLLDEFVSVPTSEVPVWLHDIVMVPAPSPRPYDEASIDAIRQDRILAQAASSEAESARDAAGVQAGAASDSADQARVYRDSAGVHAEAAAGSASHADEALSVVVEARESAQTSASSAHGSSVAAEHARIAAADHAEAAQHSASEASVSRDKAALWAEAAAVSETTAVEASTSAQAASGEARDSADSVRQSERVATQAASNAQESAGHSSTAAEQASSSADKAEQWAGAGEDIEVEPGAYSSKHHAQKAAASAEAAGQDRIVVEQKAEQATASAGHALEAVETARRWAEAEGEVEPGAHSAKYHAERAAASDAAASTARLNAQELRDQAVVAQGAAEQASAAAQESAEAADQSRLSAQDAAVRAEQAAAVTTGGMVEFGAIDLSSNEYPPVPQSSGIWRVIAAGTVDGIDFAVGDTLVYSKNLGEFYKLDTRKVELSAGDVGAEEAGAVQAHESRPDPHTQYAMKSDVEDALGRKVDAVAGQSLMTDAERARLAGIEIGAQVNSVTSVAGRDGAVLLGKDDVGLGRVDNTSDADKPVSIAQRQALDEKVDSDDERLSDTREWTAGTVTQAEAEAGAATTRRAWTAQRVRQAVGSANAASATKLQTPRSINGVPFDGTQDVAIPVLGPSAISDITGLQAALNGKANSNHNHPLSSLLASGATTGQVPVWNGSNWVPGAAGESLDPGTVILSANPAQDAPAWLELDGRSFSRGVYPQIDLMFPGNVGLAVKQANPASLPVGGGNRTAFSPDGAHLAIAHSTSPYLTIYKKTATTLTKLANPSQLPTAAQFAVAFTPNGKYLLVYGTGKLYVYSRIGDTFLLLESLSVGGYADVFSIASATNYDYHVIFTDPSGTTPVREVMVNIEYGTLRLRDISDYGLSYFKGSAAYAAEKLIALSEGPTLRLYKWDYAPSLISGFSSDYAQIEDLVFSPDGEYLAVALKSSPFIATYKRNSNPNVKYAKESSFSALPHAAATSIAFSHDSNHLVLTHSTTPFITIYRKDAGVFTKLANPAQLPTSGSTGASFSPDGSLLAMLNTSTPFISTYSPPTVTTVLPTIARVAGLRYLVKTGEKA